MYYPGFLGLCISPSNTGKTTHVLSTLKELPSESFWDQVYIYSFSNDTQFDSLELNVPVKLHQYADLEVENIPPKTFIVFDELNSAMQEHSHVFAQVQSIFSTRAHHSELTAVCLMQTILKTNCFPLLRMSHAIILQTQNPSNLELLPQLRLLTPVTESLKVFFSKFHDHPRFVTIYKSPPIEFHLLYSVLFVWVHPKFGVFFSLNPHKKMATLASEYEKAILPIMGKGFDNALCVLPLEKVTILKHVEPKKDEKLQSQDELAERCESNVNNMILYTCKTVRQQRQYRSMWFVIRNEPSFRMDPDTLVLTHKETGHKIGLQPFLSLLHKPSFLIATQKKPAPTRFSPAELEFTVTLMSNMCTDKSSILNTRLKREVEKILKKREVGHISPEQTRKRKRMPSPSPVKKRKRKRMPSPSPVKKRKRKRMLSSSSSSSPSPVKKGKR